MSCREQSDLRLWTYLDDELSSDERDRLVAHLDGCLVCRARLEQMRRRPLAMGAPTFVSPPPDLQRRVVARLIVERRDRGRRHDRYWVGLLLQARRLTALAATAFVLVVGSATVVAAVLAMPAVEGAPGGGASLANNMVLAIRQALRPLVPFFADWGWFVVLIGMVAATIVLGARALVTQLRAR